MEKVGKIFRSGLVKSVKEGLESNQGAFVVNFSSLTGSQMDGLRRDMRKLNAKVYVVKNRVAKLALEELELKSLADVIESQQMAFTWTNEDSAAVAKALMNFAKDVEGVSIQGGVLDGAVLVQNDVKRLADLPSKEVLQAQLLGTIIAPLTRLASALNAKSRDLLSILKQLSEQKGGN